MFKRMSIAIVILVIIFGGTFAWLGFRIYMGKKMAASYAPPPTTVSTTKVIAKTWHPELDAIGSFKAVNSVNVTTDEAGLVLNIYFKSGEMVKAGQPLIHLDDLIDQQTLKNDLAELKFNQLTFERQHKLYLKQATSKSVLDDAQAKLAQSEAAVGSARVRIEKKTIRAPFTGKIGIRQVNLGQYLSPGDSIAPLQSMDPLYVDFTLPEQDLKDLYIGQAVAIKVEAYPDQVFRGTISAVNSQVDITTRNIMIRALVPNDSGQLYPGVFANIAVILPQQKNILTVPQTAISYSLFGDTVFVVSSRKNKQTGKTELYVNQRFVRVGARKGNLIEIFSGLKVGEEVVTSGQIKLHPGSIVVINNSINPI